MVARAASAGCLRRQPGGHDLLLDQRHVTTLSTAINVSAKERYSVPFFSGRPAHEVVALDRLADGETPKYPPTTVEQHMRDGVRVTLRKRSDLRRLPDLRKELAVP